MGARIPLKQIAELAGVSRMTVSRALRDGTAVRPGVRAKIRRIAGEIGYERNVQISEVMSAIRRSNAPTYQENIAFIWTHRRGSRRSSPFFQEEFEGAQTQARQLGYRLEEFSPKAESLNGRALS